jgi:molybdopterin converting factor small subunit
MTVAILFFGATADLVGAREQKMGTDGTLEELLTRVTALHPKLSRHKLLIAVNEQYADADTLLKDGDEVAIFTAVSGG